MRYDDFTIQSESYRKDFWNKMMKGQTAPYETMNKGAISSDTYVLPYDSNRKYMDVLKDRCKAEHETGVHHRSAYLREAVLRKNENPLG